MSGSRATEAETVPETTVPLNRAAFRDRGPYGTLKTTRAICHADVQKLQMFQNRGAVSPRLP